VVGDESDSGLAEASQRGLAALALGDGCAAKLAALAASFDMNGQRRSAMSLEHAYSRQGFQNKGICALKGRDVHRGMLLHRAVAAANNRIVKGQRETLAMSTNAYRLYCVMVDVADFTKIPENERKDIEYRPPYTMFNARTWVELDLHTTTAEIDDNRSRPECPLTDNYGYLDDDFR
jgi:hypothetical protein